MRERKFRGKDLVTGEWRYGYLVIWRGRPFILTSTNELSPEWNEVIPETVGEFTGLKDKNSKEIWEGDVVEFRASIRTVVVYWGGAFGYWLFEKESFKGFVPFAGNPNCTFNGRDQQDENFEVIGNIHDNPELLK